MPQSNKSPSQLYELADSFSVVPGNRVRLTLPTDYSDTWTQDYSLPSDITIGSISTAKIVSIPGLQAQRQPRGNHLGRPVDKKSFWDNTAKLRTSKPRFYLSPAIWSNLDRQTPAILPKKHSQQARGIADPYGGVFVTYMEPVREYDVALLTERRVSGDKFLYEDEVVDPRDYPNPDTAINLLIAMRDHIRQNGTLMSEQQGA